MDRFGIIIESQEQLERLIREIGFMPFFKNAVKGFSIEEMTPPELLFGDDFMDGPWQWKGPIIAHWESAYGKFFKGKTGYISLEWLPDFINWRRSIYPLKKQEKDARHILNVLVKHESMLSKQLKMASGFSLSRKASTKDQKAKSGTMCDSLISKLQMGTHACIADFEYLVSKKGETYGWGVARYCTPEAMYPDLFPISEHVDGRTPKQSRERIVNHLCNLFPDVSHTLFEKII